MRFVLATGLLVGGVLAPCVTGSAAWAVTPGAKPEYCAEYAQESAYAEAHPIGEGRRIAVIGDSYSLGVGLKDKTQAWVDYVDGRVQVFGFGGSGFGTASSPCGPEVAFAARAVDAVASQPDLIIVEGGLNDSSQPTQAVESGFRDLVKVIGTIPTVVVGPAPAPPRVAGAARVDATLAELAAAYQLPYVSMISEHFDYLPPRRLHLTAASHQAYGVRVQEALAGNEKSSTPTANTPDNGGHPAKTAPTTKHRAAGTQMATPAETSSASDRLPWDFLATGLGGVLVGFVLGSRYRRSRRRH